MLVLMFVQFPVTVGSYYSLGAAHMNVNDLLVKAQFYQECYIIPHPHFDPDIKNTITIFHHSRQAFESTDKP